MRKFWESHNTDIALSGLILIFLISSVFIALRIKILTNSIIPDETAHFIFSQHFATTIGIPPDTYETASWGWYIKQNPFMYYWVNGRIINIINFLNPKITVNNLLISLRVINVIYAIVTIIFCFLLSREVIQNKWWQLLPVFLLTHTLMFVFLAGGVNYDNLANMFSMIGLYFFIRVIKQNNFLNNSLAWMISIGLGCLVKYTILPLALIMSITWLIFIITQKESVFPVRFKGIRPILLSSFLIFLAIGNFAIYGANLIRFQALTPPCREILLESQCEISGYEQRHQEIALEKKLTIKESVEEGYPSPIRYAFVDWVYHMLMRSFGMISHEAYFPQQIITFLRILFYWMILISFFNLIYWQRISNVSLSLLAIIAFYATVLFIQNYNSELVYGFKQIALQGRYIFPVIGAIYVIFAKALQYIPFRLLRWLTLGFTMIIFILGGPITILREYDLFLLDWFY